jgi:hypothetical protein
LDVSTDWLNITGFLKGGQAMTKVADAGYDEFLGVRLDQHMSTGVWSAGRWRGVYLCGGHILGRPDPLDRVANLLDGIDKRTDVSGDVVE